MAYPVNVDDMADTLYDGVSLLARRLHQSPAPGELSIPERSALARLDRQGPSATADLARTEQITPQAMANTLASLEKRGLVRRRPDPMDRRRAVVSLTEAGEQALRHKRDARGRQLAAALSEHFTPAELDGLAEAVPLIRRLADAL